MNNKLALNADTDIKNYMRAMKIVDKKVLPATVAGTLNDTANATTKQQRRNVKNKMILRSKYTDNSMHRKGKAINLARGINIDRMFSRAGSFSPYLWLQEDDSEQEGINGAKPIPTLQARTGKNLRKSIRKVYRLNRSQSLQPGNLGADGRKFVGKAKGNNRRTGLYERTNNNKKLRMIRNLESDKIKIKGTHFHSNAVKKYGTQQYMSASFYKNIQIELRKKGVA